VSTSLTRTLAKRWKAWRKYENRRTTPGVPTQKRWYVLACLVLLGTGGKRARQPLRLSHQLALRVGEQRLHRVRIVGAGVVGCN